MTSTTTRRIARDCSIVEREWVGFRSRLHHQSSNPNHARLGFFLVHSPVFEQKRPVTSGLNGRSCVCFWSSASSHAISPRMAPPPMQARKTEPRQRTPKAGGQADARHPRPQFLDLLFVDHDKTTLQSMGPILRRPSFFATIAEHTARVVKSVNTADLKSAAARLGGSNPLPGHQSHRAKPHPEVLTEPHALCLISLNIPMSLSRNFPCHTGS